MTQEAPKLAKRKLPGTDLEISPIGYGSEYIDDLGLVDGMVKQGVNYIDTAWMYQRGNAERKVAEILRNNPGTHVFTKPNRAIPPTADKQVFLQSFAESYERLGVETVDIMFIHDCRTPEKVESTGCWEAFQELKQAGKVKWFGMSTHYGTTECVLKATELGWFNVIMPAWNFMSPPALTEAIKQAADKGIGVISIKTCQPLSPTCPGWWMRATDAHKGKLEGTNLFQASIKWTLSHDFIASTVLAMANHDEANEDIAAAREA
ncbi:MAG: aldo/keto reductase, partial [Armatimonadota bacterium]